MVHLAGWAIGEAQSLLQGLVLGDSEDTVLQETADTGRIDAGFERPESRA